MKVNNIHDFQNYILKKLTFSPYPKDFYTRFTNNEHPEYGSWCLYRREGFYELGIADYTIPTDFSVTFQSFGPLLRFGTLFAGKTHFRLTNEPASSFFPSSFLVYEQNISGKQIWKAGEHFHGIEFTVFDRYLQEVLMAQFPSMMDFNTLSQNYTYKYIPADVIRFLGQAMNLHTRDLLSPLYLEGLLMECFAAFDLEFSNEMHVFQKTVSADKIPIGSNRFLTFDETDRNALAHAYDILTEQFQNPPTLQHLSSQVLLSSQKLKAGFAHYYHASIYAYILSLRMAHAANLLRTTTLSIEEISRDTGYHYPANFNRTFKKTYGITPLSFRRSL